MNQSINQSQPNEPNDANGADDSQSEPEVLLFETSPYGNLDAIVQHDGRSVYLYLNQSPKQGQKFGTRACWVRNLTIGPYVINEDEMRAGIPPMLPRTDCLVREGQPLPDPDRLSIIWFEEGNGVALTEADDAGQHHTLAIIPPWSGLEGFHGYSSQCAVESPLCWPMPENPKLEQRIEQARKFWASFESSSDSANSPFAKLQSSLLEVYDARYRDDNTEPEYFTIDGGKFPPRGLIQYRTDKNLILMTVGMSLCPQPAVELFNDQPYLLRRIELALELPISILDKPQQLKSLASQLSNMAGYPWRNFTWLGAGHTCQLTGLAPDCETALLVSDADFLIGSLTEKATQIPGFCEDPVNLLWMIPLPKQQKEQLDNDLLSPIQIIAQYFESKNTS